MWVGVLSGGRKRRGRVRILRTAHVGWMGDGAHFAHRWRGTGGTVGRGSPRHAGRVAVKSGGRVPPYSSGRVAVKSGGSRPALLQHPAPCVEAGGQRGAGVRPVGAVDGAVVIAVPGQRLAQAASTWARLTYPSTATSTRTPSRPIYPSSAWMNSTTPAISSPSSTAFQRL